MFFYYKILLFTWYQNLSLIKSALVLFFPISSSFRDHVYTPHVSQKTQSRETKRPTHSLSLRLSASISLSPPPPSLFLFLLPSVSSTPISVPSILLILTPLDTTPFYVHLWYSTVCLVYLLRQNLEVETEDLKFD